MKEFRDKGAFKKIRLEYEEFLDRFDVHELFGNIVQLNLCVLQEGASAFEVFYNKREKERKTLDFVMETEWFDLYYYPEKEKLEEIRVVFGEGKNLDLYSWSSISAEEVLSSVRDKAFEEMMVIHVL